MTNEEDNIIDYDRKTPYVVERFETINGIKYKVIYTVRRGVADSRIINYDMIKIGEEN
tara:strand:- start:422 stop:595 length:174 start_codon:yes stop_codon:yes gene_type:complete